MEGLYRELIVPREVVEEIAAGGAHGFGIPEFNVATWLGLWPTPVTTIPLLRNSLDQGEAAVIQLALDEGIPDVCIDEPVGRRLARLCGLNVTGAVGVLIRARREGRIISMRETLDRMKTRGIWLSESVINFALRESGEG